MLLGTWRNMWRNSIEDMDHHFFAWPFTKRIWRKVMELCLVPNIPTSWDDLLGWGIRNLKNIGRDVKARMIRRNQI